MFLLHLFLLALNIILTKCNTTCDCQEIASLKKTVENEILERKSLQDSLQNKILERNLIQEIVHKEMLEQKIESSRLRAKIRRMEASRRSEPVSVKAPDPGLADQLEKMIENVSDINVKLDIISRQSEGSRALVGFLKKGFTSEKQERLIITFDVKSQLADMKGTITDLKADTVNIFEQFNANMTAAQTNFKKDVDAGIGEIEGQLADMKGTVADWKSDTVHNIEQFNANMTAAQNNFRKDVEAKLEKIQTKTDIKIEFVTSDFKTRLSGLNDIIITSRIDGGWSGWGTWSDCSVSCGGGTRERIRTCTNPAPSPVGRQCEGNSEIARECGTGTCPVVKEAFSAYGIITGSGRNEGVSFPNTIYNYGGAYSSSTGVFTCKVPGIYHFVVTLSIRRESEHKLCFCFLYLKNFKLSVYARKDKHEYWLTFPATAAGTIHLNKGDTVYVGECDNHEDIYNGPSTIFTGFLVSADD